MKLSFFASVIVLALTLLIGGNAVSLRSGVNNESENKKEEGANSVFFKVRFHLSLLLVASFFLSRFLIASCDIFLWMTTVVF
jgi:ABC-type transport system involved in multi-copper enzyme maturation permease subunit